MKLLESGQKVYVYCSPDENEAVRIAADGLAADSKRVCDCEVIFCDSADESNIVITTLQNSGMPFESFRHKINSGILYIEGADRRGTIFGIYDLCEQMGISPWHFFGDVPVKKRKEFILPDDYEKFDFPSVKYRGIFLNDEEELEAWSKKHTVDGTIGPETYAHIFELLLRLKANYIWPAMHVNYFNGDKRNAALADKMGIIVGTSHCDMLLRSNQNEWKPWLKEKGYEDVKYDYSIPGRNREILKEYWQESVEQNKGYDVCYTLGMRGIHDTGFVTEEIDGDMNLTVDEKQEKKKEMLEHVICDQQDILCSVLGKTEGENALQLFIPYKEVLDLYDCGLKVPEQITLMWVDDNFGYMRRYPNKEERKRAGGHGLYYHASYWAFPGMSYLFFNSNPLAQTGNELRKCYESGIQNVWVLNIGALKPLEIDMEYFLRYAWDAGKDSIEEIKDADVFLEKWLDRNFTIGNSASMAYAYNRCMQLTNVCKLEHMQSGKFVQDGYDDEGLWRLRKLKEYYNTGNVVYQRMPESEKDAFFQMVLVKLHASYYVNASFYYAEKSKSCFADGAMQAADYCVRLSRDMDMGKRKMLYYYNHVMSEGKWDGILTPEEFTPPPMALYPAGRPALVIDREPKYLFVEKDGYISIPADSYIDAFGMNIVPYIGRGVGNAIEASETEGSYAEYAFLAKSEGTFLLEIFRNLTLAPKGHLRFMVQIDGGNLLTLESQITDEWRGKWRDAVMNNGEKLYLTLPHMAHGKHILRIYLQNIYMTISKIVIYTEPRKESNMGPMLSLCYYDGYPAMCWDDLALLSADSIFTYEGVPDELEPLPMLYADADFWKIDRLYIKSDERKQRMAERKKYTCDSSGRKNVFQEFGAGVFLETEGCLSIEAEYALENSKYAYLTVAADGCTCWVHTQAETNGGNGLAMLTEGYECLWKNPLEAPAMHYVINIKQSGNYRVWMLVKFDDDRTDSCYIALDGNIQDIDKQLNRGNLFTYSMKQRWNWRMMTYLELTEGMHTFSIMARKSGLRIDRIFMTLNDEFPPDDADFAVVRGNCGCIER